MTEMWSLLVAKEPHCCKGCGREMLDRPSFREREYCLRCGIRVVLGLAPETQVMRVDARTRVVISEERAPKPILVDVKKLKTKLKPAVHFKKAKTYVEDVELDDETAEKLRQEALEELEKIEKKKVK